MFYLLHYFVSNYLLFYAFDWDSQYTLIEWNWMEVKAGLTYVARRSVIETAFSLMDILSNDVPTKS